MEEKVLIAISTRKNDAELDAIFKNIKMTHGHVDFEVAFARNNGVPLTKVYNDFLKQYPNVRYIVFVHDDVSFLTLNWCDKLVDIFKQNEEYGILGVAGSKTMDAPYRWWMMKGDLSGEVVHHLGDNKKFMTLMTPEPKHLAEVCCIDGLFIAIDRSRCKQMFDDVHFDGFHFYDISYSFKAFVTKECKVGVTNDIRVVHQSAGDSACPEYQKYCDIFVDMYKEYLPVKLLKTANEKESKD